MPGTGWREPAGRQGGAQQRQRGWLPTGKESFPCLDHLPAALTGFYTRDHLLPDTVPEGVEVLADINKHVWLDRLWLHGAEKPGREDWAWCAGLGPGI